MEVDSSIEVSDFLPIHDVRAPGIMWFLGAGASAGAGIPTAWHMIWDFKIKLFCAERDVPYSHVENHNDPRVRDRVQQHFDQKSGFPERDSEEEYSFYFEKLYPSSKDRQKYIEKLVQKGEPSFGHRVLAGLMYQGAVNVVWTTNFDRMIEDAALSLFDSSGDLSVSKPQDAEFVVRTLNQGLWPLVAKMHGDFQYDKLKNTSDELLEQEENHRYALRQSLNRFGLAVVGYSGRDDSVMKILEEAASNERAFPDGLFWFHRPDSPVFERVEQLIDTARKNGIDAHLVRSETFDELMGDIFKFQLSSSDDLQDFVHREPTWTSDASLPGDQGQWPLLRFNALHISKWPRTCRLIKCGIGGVSEVKEAIAESGADVIATRRRFGVLAFGTDAEIKSTFEPHGIEGYDLHSIGEESVSSNSAMKGLIYECLATAIGRCRPVEVIGTSNFVVAVDPENVSNNVYSKLKDDLGTVRGVVSGTGIGWREGIRIRLEHQFGEMWLLVEPTIVFEEIPEASGYKLALRNFERERLATRYNQDWNNSIEAWAQVLVRAQKSRRVSSFGISDGVDATFELSRSSPFSWRVS